MKNIVLMLAASVLMLSACQDENQADVQVSDKDKLGLVLSTAGDGANLKGIILLKDGRSINPVSGFTNFNQVQVGSKFNLSFQVLSTNQDILNVHVVSASSAKDSLFTIEAKSTPSDSTATAAFLSGPFTGTFSYCVSGNCTLGSTTVTFNEATYSSTASPNGYPAGGAGTFSALELGKKKITFANQQSLPGANPNLILNGTYTIHAFNEYLSLIRWSNDDYTCYLLKK